MSRVGKSWAGAVLVMAFGLAAGGPAFAGGTGDSLLGTLGTQLSTKQLGTARGGTAVNILDGTNTLTDSLNTTTTTLNDTASSGGSLTGTVGSDSMTGPASNVITGNSGFINAFSNTGNNVMMNASTSIFINNAP